MRHPEAGQVSIRVTRQAEAVHVVLSTSHEGLRQQLQQELPRLQTALREHGLELGQFDLNQGQQQPNLAGGGAGQMAQQQSQGQAAGDTSLATARQTPPTATEEPRQGTGRELAVWA